VSAGAAALAGVFAAVSALAACVDLEQRRLPNVLTALAAALGVAQGALAQAFGLFAAPGLPSLGMRLACALAVLLVGCAVELVWRRAHGGAHGMGLGDVKFLAAAACWVGPAVVAVFAASSLAGALVSLARGRRSFAMGPYLALFSVASLVVVSAGVSL
jgi:leader peptidase (prepilin peptidase)/N-methyltransferase